MLDRAADLIAARERSESRLRRDHSAAVCAAQPRPLGGIRKRARRGGRGGMGSKCYTKGHPEGVGKGDGRIQEGYPRSRSHEVL